MLERYKTIRKRAEAEIIEKKSRFIATVCPVESEEEAQAFVEEIRKKHWNATHNVFAYQIGERNQLQRCSDDGEPSGTAGMPILDILKGEDIKNTAVVVTRYFGGTLLGTGGLVRAYGKGAKEGLLAGQIIEKVLYQIYHIRIDYSLMGKVQYESLQMGHIIQDTLYTDTVLLVVLVEAGQKEQFAARIIDATSGQAEIEMMEAKYGTWIEEELHMDEGGN